VARALKRVDVERLNSPGPAKRTWVPTVRLDSEVFGSFAEKFARFMGTARFIGWMTVIVIVWVLWNTVGRVEWRFDPYSFTFLTLVLSLQASYADMDFLAREIASLRMRVGDLATRDFIRSELREFLEDLDERQDEVLHRDEAGEIL